MALRAAPTGQNKSYPTGTDKVGGALDWARKIIAGGFWRFKAAGDGRAVLTTTPGTDIFTSNGGIGYTTTNQAWATNIANSWYNPSAWFQLQELATSGGTPTGREIILQRSPTASAGADKFLIIAVAVTGFTGTPTSTSPPTGGTIQFMNGSTAFNSAPTTFFASSQAVINGNSTIIWHFFDSDAPCGTTGNVSPVGFVAYDSTNVTSGTLDAAFFYESLVDAAAADTHPIVVTGHHGVTSPIFGSSFAANAGSFYTAGTVRTFVWDTTNSAWLRANCEPRVAPNGLTYPNLGSPNGYNLDADGFYTVYPCCIEMGNSGASPTYKGFCETIGLISAVSAAFDYPIQIKTVDLRTWIVFGAQFLAPWPNITTAPTGAAQESSTGVFKHRREHGITDTTAPTVTISPAPGAIATTQALTVDCTDALAGLAGYVIDIDYTTLDLREAVGSTGSTGGAFTVDDHFDGAVVESNITNGKRLVFSRDIGWPDGFIARVRAFDKAGNITSVSQTYTLTASSSPSVSNISPASGSAVGVTQAIAFRVSDPTQLAVERVDVVLASGVRETAWTGTAFSSPYSAGSSRSTIVANKTFDYSIVRAPGWPTAFDVVVISRDADGNVVTTTLNYTLSATNLPTVTNISPASGSSIAPTASSGFRVSDPTGLNLKQVFALRASGKQEVVYDGSAFASVYSTSTLTPIVAGKTFDFTIIRTGGWPEDTSLVVKLVDLDGNVVSTTIVYTINVSSVPSVSNVSPANLATINATDTVNFRVSDATGLMLYLILAKYPSGKKEVVHDGSNFSTANFSTGVRSVISAGKTYDFAVTRTPGWPEPPSFDIMMVDSDGNFVTVTLSYSLSATYLPTIGPVTIT